MSLEIIFGTIQNFKTSILISKNLIVDILDSNDDGVIGESQSNKGRNTKTSIT
jgi:hypothetical protein